MFNSLQSLFGDSMSPLPYSNIDLVSYAGLNALCEKHEGVKYAREQLEIMIALCKEPESAK